MAELGLQIGFQGESNDLGQCHRTNEISYHDDYQEPRVVSELLDTGLQELSYLCKGSGSPKHIDKNTGC